MCRFLSSLHLPTRNESIHDTLSCRGGGGGPNLTTLRGGPDSGDSHTPPRVSGGSLLTWHGFMPRPILDVFFSPATNVGQGCELLELALGRGHPNTT